MSEERAAPSAGALLRQAREKKGISVGALASSIKIATNKLEALEADRFDQLPDVSFARALALAVCRALKIDSAPVLAALPRTAGHRLDQLAQGLNTPFIDRPGRFVPDEWARVGANPMVWASALVLIAAAVVYFMPSGWVAFPPAATRLATPASQPVAPDVASGVASAVAAGGAPATAGGAALESSAGAASAVSETVYSVPLQGPVAPASGAAASPLASLAGSMQVRTSAESWVEVIDAQGQPLLSRVVLPGESVGLDGAMPLRVRIGNAAATEVVFRGQAFELATHTRDNVARFELK